MPFKSLENMSKEQLTEHLKELRGDRKRGYEVKKKIRKSKDEFDNLDPGLAAKILAALEKGD